MIFGVPLDNSNSFLIPGYGEASFAISTTQQESCNVPTMHLIRQGLHNTFLPKSENCLQQRAVTAVL